MEKVLIRQVLARVVLARVGIAHAGATVTVEEADGTFRITHASQVITEVARTTIKPIARFKVRKPQPSSTSARSP